MKTIEEYAIDLVCDGAESVAEDDLNEEGEISEDDHGEACGLAIRIAHAIRANPTVVLALVQDREALRKVLYTALSSDWEIDSSGYAKAAQAVMAAGWVRTHG